ncbi:hypothetical protein EVAR_36410_1 [Eumeta japonica]|uniref:Uncharacterized protein n=1 Tax=Eumeta variegata TaxID=151549 RepID=A0A4C1VS82_EUMVA|nr:hypothetical protein EVAR_36410_1 [Eumeta japonica]
MNLVQKLLQVHLNVQQLCTLWTLHDLTVTGDESCVHCFEPERKRQSAEWVFPFEGLRRKIKGAEALVIENTNLCYAPITFFPATAQDRRGRFSNANFSDTLSQRDVAMSKFNYYETKRENIPSSGAAVPTSSAAMIQSLLPSDSGQGCAEVAGIPVIPEI